MRVSTIIILAVCLFSVAFANDKDAGPANSLGHHNHNRRIKTFPDAAAGKQPQDPKVPKNPKLPKVPKLPDIPKVPKLPDVPKVPKLPKVPKISNEPTAPKSVN
ncbi:protein PELPK1-like [Pieris napi]|uniref:protein PELPK1-like n=1 Tax=Pieris napi TaxID=78633 RepID=UPI001FB91455|nr:protein PELPK1-like [Pieris napi]